MLAMLQHLEPRFEKKGTILFRENDEVAELLFMIKGTIDIGFEVNKQSKFCLRFTKEVVIGAYNVCNSLRTLFVYKCKTNCSGYFIRKDAWLSILECDPEISDYIRNNVKEYYIKEIKNKVLKVKLNYINRTKMRRDVH